MRESGFTLLELIIVIIIVSVLAGLALPRFFGVIEISRSVEAISAIKVLRDSMERCFYATADYKDCHMNSPGPDPNNLDAPDPGLSPGTHFTYKINPMGNPFKYRITATRNALDGGNVGDKIIFSYRSDGSITRQGSGAFSSIK